MVLEKEEVRRRRKGKEREQQKGLLSLGQTLPIIVLDGQFFKKTALPV